ncbi:MAG: hypothetical protein JWP01_3569 [Myxococcales bacterium]|nr:hypothetical protein [Myxococcales bacterium]
MRARSSVALALIVLASCSEPDPGAPAADAADESPSVAFVEPGAGTPVANPVTFTIAAHHVDEVEVFADETFSLGPAWNPTERDQLTYRFAQTGIPRALHVVGRVGGIEVARAELSLTVAPDSCEQRFFVHEFDKRNSDPTGTIDLFSLREESLAAIEHEVETLQACGAGLTLGNMMSLLLYEGGFRVAAFNTRCSENSYNRTTSNCDAVAEALYSYQFGIGGIHTSNFHPCKGGAYTQGMRQRFLASAMEAGFPVDASLVTPALATRFATVCPTKTPTAVDYYLLGAHDVFSIPRNTSGNHLAAHATFPLFAPKASVALTFGELAGACASITNDRDAIRRFGGGDASYGQTAKQDEIMSYYKAYKAANCP